jgi:hypothetical protein
MLYRLYNAAGELIYVGITERFGGRFSQHEHSQWWREVERIELEPHPTRAEAQAAEMAVIRAELPKYNDCSVANAERARRGLPHRAASKRPSSVLAGRSSLAYYTPRDGFLAPFGYGVLEDGRVWIYGESGPGWIVDWDKVHPNLQAMIRREHRGWLAAHVQSNPL